MGVHEIVNQICAPNGTSNLHMNLYLHEFVFSVDLFLYFVMADGTQDTSCESEIYLL